VNRALALLLVPAAVAALGVPAGAAVPKKPATQTFPCNDGSGRSAQLWGNGTTRLAAENPCTSQWLDIGIGPEYYSSAPDMLLELAPGAHFNWGKKGTGQYIYGEGFDYARLDPQNECGGEEEALWVYGYKDVRQPAEADPARCG
jgi:hypothetical protein